MSSVIFVRAAKMYILHDQECQFDLVPEEEEPSFQALVDLWSELAITKHTRHITEEGYRQ